MEALRVTKILTARINDAAIVQRILSGEKELFEIILRRYNQRLYRVIRGYLTDSAEVQDAMQNTYLKAYDKLFQFRGDSTFSTWLIRIAINEALLQLRNNRRERKWFTNGPQPELDRVRQIPDPQMNPEMQIINQEGERLVEQAIDKLPEKYRLVYILREGEGMSNGQIAECLDISDDNVKIRIHRAHKLLKEHLFQLTTGAKVLEFGKSKCDAIVDFVMRNIP